MELTTTDTIPGKEIIKILGVTKGSTVRARNIGRDILALVKNLVGGEITEYTKLLAESREQALDRMKAHAKDMGANAVVSVRFMTSSVSSGAAELLVYGTAVVIE